MTVSHQASFAGHGIGTDGHPRRRWGRKAVVCLAALCLMAGLTGCATGNSRALKQLRASRIEVLANLRATLIDLRGTVQAQSFDNAGFTYCGAREGARKYEVDGAFASAERSPDLHKTLTRMARILAKAGWRTHTRWEGEDFTLTRNEFSAEFYLIGKENSDSPIAIGMKAAGSCFTVGDTGSELIGLDDLRPLLGM